MPKFIFEIPIECDGYNPETCERDYGSKECYNSDFPEHVHAMEIIWGVFTDASTHCLMMAMEDMARTKAEGATDFSQRMQAKSKFYTELANQLKCVRKEE